MRGVLWTRYGPPDLLQLKDLSKPVPGDSEVLVRIHATTVNRTDCATIRAKPFFMRIVTGLLKPGKHIPGSAYAGEIEAVGRDVASLVPGDRVFGFDDDVAGAHAQYLAGREDRLLKMPDNVTPAVAAASIEGAHYAYNFINKVESIKGRKVLVNGATGAIGSAAVQLLKYFETDVTAVCSTEKIDLVKSLGADRVIDYRKSDFTRDNQQYDLVFDTVGKSSFFKCRRLLLSGGIYISSDLGFLAQNLYLPLITPLVKPLLGNKKTVLPLPVDIKGSLQLVSKLMEQGKFEPVIDRTYPLEDIIEAYRYVEKGHKTGNVVVTVE